MRRINPAASCSEQGQHRKQDQQRWLPKHLHHGSIKWAEDMAIRNSRRRLVLGLSWLLLCLLSGRGRAESVPAQDLQIFRARVEARFEAARDRWQRESNSVEAAWQLGKAAFDWAECATSDAQRSTLAELGIAACRRGIALDSNGVAAHYYLGLNLGQLARTKLLGAFKLISEMEAEWSTAIQLDPRFDYGGPHRTLGTLYRDAPGWPTSIGSEKKARQHLEKALELHPDFPGNMLSLLEGRIEWGEKKVVRDKTSEIEAFLSKARQAFAGDAWVLDWDDWDRRWTEVKRKAGVK